MCTLERPATMYINLSKAPVKSFQNQNRTKSQHLNISSQISKSLDYGLYNFFGQKKLITTKNTESYGNNFG